MIVLDVNILLAAHRADHPQHQLVRPWFDGLLQGEEPFAVPGFVWASFIRISTNRRIFTIPTPLEDSFAFLKAVVEQPHHVALAPGEQHLELFEQLCRDSQSAGDLAMDAYLAAFAMEHGSTLASLDRDFARFPSLRCVYPGA